MSMKKPVGIGLLIGILALAFAALPALASAAPTFDPAGAGFTGVSGLSTLHAGALPEVTCKKDKNTGSFNAGSGTAGTVEITFEECMENALGTSCTTSGTPTGVITTETLPFDTIYINKAHTTAGLLLTKPANGKPFAKFSCAGGLVTVTVTGNGIIGDITAPKFNTKSKTLSLSFAGTTATSSVQKFQQIEEAGTKFHLEASTGGTPVEAAQDTEAVETLNGGIEGELTNT